MRLLYGFNYLVIARAATEISHHPVFDLVFVWSGILFEQRRSSDDLAWGANPALKTAVLNKAFMHRVELAIFRQTFNRGEIMTVRHDCEGYARTDHVAVHQDGAGAANADT